MANHYHLVMKTGAIPLWRSMLRLQSEVARAFNKRHRYLGRLFEHHYTYGQCTNAVRGTLDVHIC